MIYTPKQIRDLRARRAETRQQFARAVGTAEKTIYLWEMKGVSDRTWPRCVDALRLLLQDDTHERVGK